MVEVSFVSLMFYFGIVGSLCGIVGWCTGMLMGLSKEEDPEDIYKSKHFLNNEKLVSGKG